MKEFFKKSIIVFSFFSFVWIPAFSQLSNLPVKNINGERYYYYKVKAKETVFSLSKRFGISQEDFYRYNPSTRDGLKIDQELLFPVSAEKTLTDESKGHIARHTVVKGETAYGLSHRYGMTQNEFYDLNPSARDGLKEGQIVMVYASDSKSESAHQPDLKNDKKKPAVKNGGRTSYTVKKKDTFYSISQMFGIDVAHLQAANPGVNVIKEGQTLIIPDACDNNPTDYASASVVRQSDMVEKIPEKKSISQGYGDTAVIAVALPFMADDENRSKAAANATEFYKGLLLAVDSLGSFGRPIKVLTFDTKGSMDGVRKILLDSSLKQAEVIIAPDKADQLAALATFAKNNAIYLVNPFVIKDESYKTNPFVMQTNVPHNVMYDKGSDYYLSSFPGITPVILNRTDGLKDKQEFINLLKEKCTSQGRDFIEISFEGNLSAGDLSTLNGENSYAFIPMSSKSDELAKVMPALGTFKTQSMTTGSLRLWGYPEWLILRGDMLDKIHQFDSYVFSRFCTQASDPDIDKLNSQFTKWFGSEMADLVPRQGTYGFDLGAYLIAALNANNGDFSRYTPSYDGIQNAFNFMSVPGGGWLNNEMFIINYTPAKTVFKQGI